jgi:hypothetical protein
MSNKNNSATDTQRTLNRRPEEQVAAPAGDVQIPRKTIFVIALIQGVALAYLYQSVEHGVWPSSDLMWLTALVTFFVSFPSLFLLTASQHDYSAILKTLLPFTLLISVLGAYIGNQQSAFPNIDGTFFVFTLAILIACFKAIMYIKLLANKQTIDYESLFSASWRNAIIFAATILFMSIFFGILNLGAALFDLLGISFFTKLLREEWFWVPALTLSSAFAIHIFRKISYLADNISTILQTLMKFLLPVLVFISLGFLATLPFTGLTNLWETRSGSLLLLWLIALSLFFVNAIYHRGSDNKPYHFIVHRFVLVGVAILPIYAAISAYGISLRIIQYGFTPDRLWALSIWFILSCFTIGYLFGVIKQRDNWLIIQSKVNVFMGLVLLAFVLLVNSPLLNFKAISSDSQMARYYDGEVAIDELDIYYFSNNLGKPGYIAMEQLKTEVAQSHPEIVASIDREYSYIKERSERRNGIDEIADEKEVEITYWPDKNAFNPSLISYLNETDLNYRWAQEEFRVAIDLDQDSSPEMITISDNNGYFRANLWTETEEGWEQRNIKISIPKNKDLKYSLQNIEIQLLAPQYKIINLDGININANH